MSTTDGPDINGLLDELKSGDLQRMLAAVELAVALDDSDLIDAMLTGTEYQRGGERPRVGKAAKWNKPRAVIGRIVPGSNFASTFQTLLWDELACVHLIARSGHRLVDEITHLDIEGWMNGYHFAPSIAGLDGLTALIDLEVYVHVRGGHPLDLTPLTSMTAVKNLTIRANKPPEQVLEVPPIDHVESLTLRWAPNARLAGAENLRSLSCDSPVTTVELPQVRSLVTQTLTDDLVTLVPNLEQLQCTELLLEAAIPAVDFVEPPPDGSRTFLEAKPEHLATIGRLSGLQMLRVSDDDAGAGSIPLAELMAATDLRVVDVHGTSTPEQLAALADHPTLQMIRLTNCRGITETDVPKAMKSRVSFAAKPNFDKAAAQKPSGQQAAETARSSTESPSPSGARSSGMSGPAKKQLSRLKKLLTAPNAEDICQGVELAASLGDTDLVAALLDGVTYSEDDSEFVDGSRRHVVAIEGRLVPNKTFTGSGSRRHWLDLAMVLLVAATGHPLRDAIRGLSLGQRYYSTTPLDVFPIAGLADLPNLERLELMWRGICDVDLAALSACNGLRSLSIRGTSRGEASAVPSLQRLESAELDGVMMDPVGTWPALTELTIGRTTRSGGQRLTGAMAPALRTLTALNDVDLHDLSQLQELELGGASYSVRSCRNLHTLTGSRPALVLDDLPQLTTVRLGRASGAVLDQLAAVGTIENFSVEVVADVARFVAPAGASTDTPLQINGPIGDLGEIGSMRGLRWLTIRGQDQPLALDPLANAKDLRVLDIRGCAGITSVEPLGGLDELRIVAVKNSGVTTVPDAVSHVISRAANPDLDAAMARAQPRKTTKKSAPIDDGAVWDRIEAGLATDSLDIALEAVGLAISTGPDAVRHLLSKLSVRSHRISARAPFRLDSKPMAAPLAAALLHAADPDWKEAQKLSSIDTLCLTAKTWGDSLSSGDLSGFANLERLLIDKGGRVHLSQLDRLAIDTLSVQAKWSVTVEGALPTTLDSLLFGRSMPDLAQLSGSAVSALYLAGIYRIDLAGLGGWSSLNEVHIGGPVRSVTGIDQLATVPVTEVTLPGMVDLDPLIGHPTLQRLNLWSVPADLPDELAPIVRRGHGPQETFFHP